MTSRILSSFTHIISLTIATDLWDRTEVIIHTLQIGKLRLKQMA
jgi:hypothetical protein